MSDRITYVGLDVHKESIVVAVASGGLRGEVREYGRIANTAAALDRLQRKLGVDGMTLRFCYEAGPCGYGIQRRLSAHGQQCVVVAPSLIPKRAGDRVGRTRDRLSASYRRLGKAQAKGTHGRRKGGATFIGCATRLSPHAGFFAARSSVGRRKLTPRSNDRAIQPHPCRAAFWRAPAGSRYRNAWPDRGRCG
jgi:hypothetical protein